MRRKNRKWVLAAVAAYLLIMGLAYRWSEQQIPADGPLLVAREREEVRKWKTRQAQEAAARTEAQSQPQLTAEPRLTAAGPAFVAARYDRTHVVFVVTTDAESRFSQTPLRRLAGTPTRIPASLNPAAPLAGLQELWEPDPSSIHFLPKIIQTAQSGDQWILSLTSSAAIPINVEHPIFAPTGCSLALGFLAAVPADKQTLFNGTPEDYFVVRRVGVVSADPPAATQIFDLAHWKPAPGVGRQIEQQLTERMKQELAKIDARLVANAGSPGAETPAGSGRPRLKEWLHADKALARGAAVLDYDVHAFAITPDGIPRLFVRARWTLDGSPVFLMTAWFKANAARVGADASSAPASRSEAVAQPDTTPTLLFADSTWSLAMREGSSSATLGDTLEFETVLNQFDADHDGWAELLIHSQVPDSGETPATALTLYLYTDQALVPMKLPFVRDGQSPESCIDP